MGQPPNMSHRSRLRERRKAEMRVCPRSTAVGSYENPELTGNILWNLRLTNRNKGGRGVHFELQIAMRVPGCLQPQPNTVYTPKQS